ncbi:TIM barrel protein [candidate division KSB1 bacterium]|nr:TIM barrel protein [candidate division KSB1 bacterium]
MKPAFCLEMMFTDRPFVDRLDYAARAGVEFIEFWDWRDKDLDLLSRRLGELDMHVVNFSGNRSWSLLDPLEEEGLLFEVLETVDVAKRLKTPHLMLLAQPLASDGSAIDRTRFGNDEVKFGQIVFCGQKLARLADRCDIDFVIEPLNTRIDHPGYFLDSSALAFQLVREIDHPRVKILYDVYHMAAMDQPVFSDLANYLPLIGYIHIADFPGRGYPGTGRFDFSRFMDVLKEQSYAGTVGFEFSCTPPDSEKALQKSLELFAR